MSAADDLRKNAQRFRQNRPAQTAVVTDHPETSDADSPRQGSAVPTPPPAEVIADEPIVAPRQKGVRRTVDLSPNDHARLNTWQGQAAQQLGRARVSGQDVLEALVKRLLTDESLARQIRQEIHHNK